MKKELKFTYEDLEDLHDLKDSLEEMLDFLPEEHSWKASTNATLDALAEFIETVESVPSGLYI